MFRSIASNMILNILSIVLISIVLCFLIWILDQQAGQFDHFGLHINHLRFNLFQVHLAEIHLTI